LNISLFEKQLKKQVNNIKPGLKLIKKMEYHLSSKPVTNEVNIKYLGIIFRFFLHFNKVNQQIKTLTYLASLYIDYNAMQSAYRTLNDGLQIAKAHNKPKSVIELYELYFVACMAEGDIDEALNIYEYLDSLTTHFDIKLDDSLIFNVGTAYLQKFKTAKAIKIFNSFIGTPHASLEYNCKLNLSICYRYDGDIDKSLQLLEEIEFIESNNIDYDIEYHLVYAKTLVEVNRYKESIVQLKYAVSDIDDVMRTVIKLHFRRGVREKYIKRLELLLLSIPSEYLDENVLDVISFTRSNQTSDWLYLLDWCDDIYSTPLITAQEKETLATKINNVASNGAPFLYGMREKYDDFYPINIDAWRWDELALLTNELTHKYSLKEPLSKSEACNISKLMKVRLNDNSMLVSFISLHSKIMIIHKGSFEVISLDPKIVHEYVTEVHRYKLGDLGSSSFAKLLEIFQKYLYKQMEKSLHNIDKDDIKGLLYLPDSLSFIPLLSTTLMHIELKKKMIEQKFVTRTTPILFPKQNSIPISKTSKILGIFEEESLKLSSSEILNFKNNLEIESYSLLKHDVIKDNFISKMKDASILHVTTHGSPIDYYTDAFHAKLTDKHVISTQIIQANFYNLNYSLVLLNSCHSSSGSTKRQINLADPKSNINRISTNELFSFPTLFLLNRKSYNISSSWKTFDKFSFILSHNISKNLFNNLNIEKAFSKAIAEITMLTEDNIELNLNNVSIEDKKILLSNKKGIVQMLRHPYSYATYQLFSLF
jgi:tetratricopeptide (TPR) repeat protein